MLFEAITPAFVLDVTFLRSIRHFSDPDCVELVGDVSYYFHDDNLPFYDTFEEHNGLKFVKW